jgi:DNA-binding transcriptional regulator YiaG
MRNSVTSRKRPRARVWRLSPDGFRALRHSCFLSRQACADFLGVSLRTVRYWDAGRCRVPWAVVRLLRFVRLGDLGALDAAWSGWTLNRNGLWSPDGKRFEPAGMRYWWLTSEQARFWRDDYDRRTLGGVGAPAPALTLQPEAGEAVQPIAAAPALPIKAAPPPNPLFREATEKAGLPGAAPRRAREAGAGVGPAPGLVKLKNKGPGNGENGFRSRFAARWAA